MSSNDGRQSLIPRAALLAIALAQSLILHGLYYASQEEIWPSNAPVWNFVLWTLALAVPLVLLLALETGNRRPVLRLTGVFALLLALVAAYTGFQALPYDEFPVRELTFVFACSIAVATFKALMYLQQRAAGRPMNYQVLFTYSWRNFLVLGLAGLFKLAFFLILMLWAALFAAIGIEFFREIFQKEWFLFPALGLAFGTGIVVFRNLTGVIDAITRLLQGLIKLLLPLIVLIAVMFLLALPFTGLDALWSTHRGTGLLLWLLAVMLFFTNAVYQDGRGAPPYPLAVHRLVYCGLLSLPFVSGLALYGLSLRVGQYGWSISRCWAMLVWILLTLFAVGYVIGILRRRDAWTVNLARVNTAMGLFVLILMLLVNSPLIDFRKITVASQLARVEAGQIGLDELDYYYFERELARPGYLARESIREQAADDPELLALLENPQPSWSAVELMENGGHPLELRPTDLAVPEEVRRMIAREPVISASVQRDGGKTITPAHRSLLIEVDLDEDGRSEFLFVRLWENPEQDEDGYRLLQAAHFYRADDRWQRRQLATDPDSQHESFYEALTEGEVNLLAPRFQDIEVGGVEFRSE